MKKRKFKLINLTFGLIIISPLLIVTACANSNEVVRQEQPTVLKQALFLASDLNLNGTIDVVKLLINNQWIVTNKDLLFSAGSQYLNQEEQVLNLQVIPTDGKLMVIFQLKAGAYVAESGQIGTQASSLFKLMINHFSINF